MKLGKSFLCSGVDLYNFKDLGEMVSTITTNVGQSTAFGPKVAIRKLVIDEERTLSDGKDVIGTIDANIFVKNTNQDNTKYIIEKKARMTMEEAISEINKAAPHQQDQLNYDKNAARTLAAGTHGAASHLTKTVCGNDERCIVRRLTTTETSRLQGFPDDYTKINGNGTSDAAQYKAHGNSWATPCAFFMSSRMELEMRRLGIGGTIRYATCCSGIEAHSIAVKNLDWKSVFFSEIEPFPCDVLKHHYPTTPNLGDMTQIHYDAANGVITNSHHEGDNYDLPSCFRRADIQQIPYKVGDLHVFSGGTPCFVAGTMVLTEKGYKPIEDVKVGEKVVTHLGRLRKVVAAGSKKADNIVAVTTSSRQPILCTSDHKFWAAINPHQDFRRKSDSYLKVLFDGIEFREIEKVGVGGFVSQLNTYDLGQEEVYVPQIYNASPMDVIELAGWYVGDGHCCKWTGKNKKALILSLSKSKVDKFESTFKNKIVYNVAKHGDEGVYRITICNTELCDWLIANFGEKSFEKTIPAWVVGGESEIRKHFTKGYMATDGYSKPKNHIEKVASTTSKSLAFGLADLFGRSCVCESKTAPTKKMYDGRVVKQNTFWTVKRHTNPNRFHKYGMWDMVRVRKIEPQPPNTVYNITVEEDHSYVVNGLCVKNCQDISVAGKRKGMAEDSGSRSSLAFHYQRIIDESRPMFTLWENVCFGADTLVTTKDGHKKIKDVVVGDYVRTIDGSYQKVLKLIKTPKQDTIKISMMGADDVYVTWNHPFYAKKKNPNGTFNDPEWTPAGALTNNHFIAYRVDEKGSNSIGMANAYAVGRWLADGSVALRSEKTHNGKRGGQRAMIFISTGWKKHDSLAAELKKLPYKIGESKVCDYAINFTFTSDEFYKLIKDCGKGARNKKVPNYVYSLIPEEQEEILRGYLDGDGHKHRASEMTYSSSSKELAIGIARLVRNVYHRGVSIRYVKGAGTKEIDGRIVKAHDSWMCSFSPNTENKSKSKSVSFYDNGYVWCPVREVTDGLNETVYNLNVDGNHTYEANDIVVHNCGAFSSNGGADFIWFVNKCAESGYAMAWRVIDAQYTTTEDFPRAVPQRRRRIWLVGYRGNDWRVPARVVFELKKELTEEPPIRIPGKGFTELNPDFDENDVEVRVSSRKKSKKDDSQGLFALDVVETNDNKLKVSRLIDFEDMPSESNFALLSKTDIYDFLSKVGEPCYIGPIFRSDRKKKKARKHVMIDLFATDPQIEDTVEEEEESSEWEGADKISPGILANIGNAGILSNGMIATINCHEWTSGIQLSPTKYNLYQEFSKNHDWLKANELLPMAYDGSVCGLSDVLEENPYEKYNLSWRACFGILKRAAGRGKELPPALEIALIATIRNNAGIVKWIAVNGKATKKNETDLTERESARLCFDEYIASVINFDNVVAVEPKKHNGNDDDEVECDDSSEDFDEDGNPIEKESDFGGNGNSITSSEGDVIDAAGNDGDSCKQQEVVKSIDTKLDASRVEDELSPTLLATSYKEPPAVIK